MALSPSLIILGNDLRAAAVQILDPSGNPILLFDSSRPSTATLTQVVSSVTSVVLLPANVARRRLLIVNGANKTLFVAFGATATVTAYTVQIASLGTYQGVLNDYTGVVSGIWTATPAGSAVITEITT